MTTSAPVQTKEGALILDSHKLRWHYDRVEEWEAGERIAPVSVDMALTRACGAMCEFCYAIVQESQERSNIKVNHVRQLLDDFKEIGVRGVSLISDGESTISPVYVPFLEHAHELGIDVGNATNGWELPPEKMERVLPLLKWMRFTVVAGTPKAFARIMYKGSDHTQVFWRAMHHISHAVQFKRRKKLDVTLGIQMVLMPQYKDEILPFAQLGLDLGVDYAVIKHCSDDEQGSLGVNYSKYQETYDMLHQAEGMSTEQTKVIVKWDKIRDGDTAPYKRVYGPPFLLQISGSGLVAPSGQFFNTRYSKFHIGNFTEERFLDIFRSDRYWETMNYLASPYFDAKTMMGTLPIQHYINVALDRHVRRVELLRPATEPPPLHVNFL